MVPVEEAFAALMSPEGRGDPYPWYEALRAHGPVFRLGPTAVTAVGYAECAQALREPRLLVADAAVKDRYLPEWRSYRSVRRLTGSMLMRNPPDHARLRRLVSGAFTARRVMDLRPAVERLTDRLLDRLAGLLAYGQLNFMAEFAFRLPVAVIGELLGVPEEDQVRFRQDAADLSVALDYITDLDALAPADAAMERLAGYFTDLVAARRAVPTEDLTSALVRVRDADGDRLGESELVDNLVLLLIAGFETTTNLLGNGLRLALADMGHAARLRADRGFAAGFVDETLRFDPPVQSASTRIACADLELCGYPVPAGTSVDLLVAAANRDPRRFPEPARFDPGREQNQPLSFGGGPHFCLGAALARMEAQIALPALLRRFPTLALAGEPQYHHRLVLRGFANLPVHSG